MTDTDKLAYRPCVGTMLVNAHGMVFVGKRIDNREGDWWQMPQGGVDKGETPRDAALREMDEEIGVAAKLVDVLEETEDWLYYDFPPDLLRRMGGPYLGQRQKWYALRFKGSDSDVRLDKHTPEFDAWRWARLDEAPGLIVPFKRPVYEDVAVRFEKWTQPV